MLTRRVTVMNVFQQIKARFITTTVIASVIGGLNIFAPVSAFAFEDRRSVDYMLPGCRFQALAPAPIRDDEWTQAFQCRDALRVVVANGPKQPKFMAACVPDHVNEHDIARAIVERLERNPERLKERFDIRAASALHDAWPCP